MKKIIGAILVFALLTTGLSGCGKSTDTIIREESGNEDRKLQVVSTIFPGYDFVRAIAGDHVQVKMLLPPGAESHSFDPTAQDIMSIQDCDLFLCVGGESETWVNTLLNSIDTSGVTMLSMMDVVETVEEEIREGMQEEAKPLAAGQNQEQEANGTNAEEKEYDEHVWTSPQNAMRITQAILTELCRLDPANAADYQANAESYLQELNALDAAFRQVVQSGERRTLIFGDRFPFRYFADEYGLDYYAAFPGCSSQTEASAKTIAFLMRKVKEEKIPVVFYIESSNGKMAEAICEDTGAKKLLFHSCHNVTKTEFSQGVTYLELMKRNVEHLKEAI